MSTWLRRNRRAFRNDLRGTAAVEFALAATLLLFGLLNAVDFGYYLYQRMEVENAAEAGAQAVWKTCSDQSTMLPATQNCSGLNAVITMPFRTPPSAPLFRSPPARRPKPITA